MRVDISMKQIVDTISEFHYDHQNDESADKGCLSENELQKRRDGFDAYADDRGNED